MTWTERQRRMLAAMGVRLWSPAPAIASTPSTDGPGAVSVARPGAREAEAQGGTAIVARGIAAPESPPIPDASVQPLAASSTAAAGSAASPTGGARALDATPAALPATPAVSRPAVAARQPAVPAPATDRAVTLGSAASSLQAALADPLLAERAATIATLDWGPLREAVAACTACGLCASRRQTVFGVGHVRADWMVVGEAPGEQEDIAGEPFVGPAGQLLDQMLRAVGRSRRAAATAGADAPQEDDAGDPRQRVFIANTLKCRPPRNRNPEPEEMARCEPFLQRQVALVQPRLILAMGRFAVRQLLKSDDAIGKLRGRVHRYEGIPVIVTYHPAYLLRNLPDKAKAWEDLCLARSIADAAA